MKKPLLILTLASAMIISACSNTADINSEEQNGTNEPEITEDINPSMGGLQVINPIKTYGSADEIKDALGFTVNPIPESEDITFSTISNDIAQVRFTYNGLDCTLRANDDDGDFSGVYTASSSEETVNVEDSDENTVSVLIKKLTDGNTLLFWSNSDNSIHYSMYILGNPDDISNVTNWAVSNN